MFKHESPNNAALINNLVIRTEMTDKIFDSYVFLLNLKRNNFASQDKIKNSPLF